MVKCGVQNCYDDVPLHPWRFILLVLLFSAPLWLLAELFDGTILPGLPVSSLMAISPAVAGAALVFSAGGKKALGPYLRRVFDGHRVSGVKWWVIALGFMPSVFIATYFVQMATGGEMLMPAVHLGQLLVLFLVFFLAASAEEIGWTGYAAEPLLKRFRYTGAASILGLVWAAWHVVPLMQAGRNWEWIAWWSIGTVGQRFVILWIYTRGGRSVLASSLFHAMGNVSWMVFPVMGSLYDPRISALLLFLFVAAQLMRFGADRAIGSQTRDEL